MTFNTCMVIHNNNPDASIDCCLGKCSATDLTCQETCIDSFNETIVETFGFFHISKLATMAIINVCVMWYLFSRPQHLPTHPYQRLGIIILIQFGLYLLVKQKV